MPGCSARWAPSATRWTTPSPSSSSPPCNANSSTGTTGPPGPGSPERCSAGSKPSTTRPAATAPSATSAPSTTRRSPRHDHHTNPVRDPGATPDPTRSPPPTLPNYQPPNLGNRSQGSQPYFHHSTGARPTGIPGRVPTRVVGVLQEPVQSASGLSVSGSGRRRGGLASACRPLPLFAPTRRGRCDHSAGTATPDRGR